MDRPDEARQVDDFLASASTTPCALVVEGEPGIGKTTLWLAAVEQARERGFLVMSARPAQNESVLAYSSLADLLGDVDDVVLESLPELQRIGLDHVLVRTQTSDTATDLRAVAAGFLSVTEKLADAGPVLIAIDDLQFLDSEWVGERGFRDVEVDAVFAEVLFRLGVVPFKLLSLHNYCVPVVMSSGCCCVMCSSCVPHAWSAARFSLA